MKRFLVNATMKMREYNPTPRFKDNALQSTVSERARISVHLGKDHD